jgi:hypothetical protein
MVPCTPGWVEPQQEALATPLRAPTAGLVPWQYPWSPPMHIDLLDEDDDEDKGDDQ